MNATKYSTLLNTLKSEILRGKYRSNEPFPSVRALIGRFQLSDRTVRHALDELFAQGLISRQQGRGTFVSRLGASRKIGLCMPDAAQSEYFVRIFRELMRLAEARQYKLQFAEIKGSTAKERAACTEQLVNTFISQRVSGVIVQPLEYYDGGCDFNRRLISRLDNAKIPMVLCDNGLEVSGCPYDVVGTNNIESSFVLYRHLTEAGARNICFFMRPYSPLSHFGRAQGFVLSHLPKLTGVISKRAVMVAEPDDAVLIGRRIKANRIDAFMCGDDETAAKLMQTLYKLGYEIPKDILVTGYNDLNVARLLSPTLTTMRCNCEAIADMAFDRLIKRINEPELPPTEVFLPVELIVRESSMRKKNGERE